MRKQAVGKASKRQSQYPTASAAHIVAQSNTNGTAVTKSSKMVRDTSGER